jgi:superfamily II DNA or RNA helicase
MPIITPKDKYDKINKEFKKYKLKPSSKSMNEICLPKQFKFQPQQLFLRDYFNSKLANKGLLIYHQIGAGKTCTAITIAESLKHKMKIMIVLPAALIGNFRDELRSGCGGEIYLSNEDRDILKTLESSSRTYKNIIKKSDKIIDSYYKIYSYHIFVDKCKESKIKLKNTLLIIDEIQNMISEGGTFYTSLKKVVDKSDDNTRIILLSATPMFNKPEEIALTLNLLKLKKDIPIGNEFNKTFVDIIESKNGLEYRMKNIDLFKSYIPNVISYYRGAEPQSFPKTIFKLVKCKMEPFQYKSYRTVLDAEEQGNFMGRDILKLPSDFLLGPRLISNIAFPNKRIDEKGFESLSGVNLKKKNIMKYSKKFYKILNKISKSLGPTFVYSNFKDIGGIKSFVQYLEYNGYSNYTKTGSGSNRFAIWSGDESSCIKENIKHTFNNKNNINGNMIKIIIGSPSIKEGVSLLRVAQVHIMEPYWNMSRILQIIGRAVRFCSHKDVPRERRVVEVYLYLATYPNEETTDMYIWLNANKKHELIEQFEHTLKEMAIDCKLFYNRNVYKNDKSLKCI